MEIIEYVPKTTGDSKQPLVISLPGLVDSGTNGRISKIMQTLADEGIPGVQIFYTEGKTAEDSPSKRTIEYDVDVPETILTIAKTRAEKLSGGRIDLERIALLACSFGAIPATRYLIEAQKAGIPTRAIATISPIVGWEHFTKEAERDLFENRLHCVPFEQNREGTKTTTKYIPGKRIPELKQVNLIEELKLAGYKPLNTSILTVIGTEDQISNPGAMAEYHILLSGSTQGLKRIPAGHDVPNSNEYVANFLINSLSNQPGI